jgi:hypothetical protein
MVQGSWLKSKESSGTSFASIGVHDNKLEVKPEVTSHKGQFGHEEKART